jgi:hypothetical protein
MSGDDKKESTIYTHYGTIPTSERREHKAAQGRARACHHFFLRHEACVNRHLRFGKESVEENCKELLDNWRRCFAGSAAQVTAALPFSDRLHVAACCCSHPRLHSLMTSSGPSAQGESGPGSPPSAPTPAGPAAADAPGSKNTKT